LIDGFYLTPDAPGAVDWRSSLDGEELVLTVCGWGTPDAAIVAVTYVADGVCQVAPPAPFDSLRCAAALDQALKAKEGKP
jgi:hypothetical protein